MIIGIDIGGTKTLVAVFAENGKLLKQVRFETPQDYDEFIQKLSQVTAKLEARKGKIACVAVSGLLDRQKGTAISLGNLPWRDINIRRDIAEVLGLPVYIENDSKLAGIAEARRITDQYSRIVYITLSTGIGTALVIKGKLSRDTVDSEVGKMPLLHNGKIIAWENFASGRAFYEKYKKNAVDVDDDEIWQEYAGFVNEGLGVVCATFQPEAIVFGGGLGQRLSRFKHYLVPYLEKNLHSNVRQPKELLTTQYKGQSVIYGCYEYAKDKLA